MRKISIAFLMMFAALTFACVGCAGLMAGKYGAMVPDSGAAAAFESFQLSAGLHYYVSGSDEYPNAMLGLNREYVLDSSLWKRIDPTPARFRDLVLQMQTRAGQIGYRQYGCAVLDDQGSQIGIWYSILPARTPVVMKGDRHVEVYTPDIDTYLRYENSKD
jgi:hypothetical protein